MGLREVSKYAINKKSDDSSSSSFHLIISHGSVVDYSYNGNGGGSGEGGGVIVNAANEGCLGGGGVDGAISSAGGRNLLRDRYNLPVLRSGSGRGPGGVRANGCGDDIRCITGDAVMTGPNTNGAPYGTLSVSHVIHAVGPAYGCYKNSRDADALLYNAYRASLQHAKEARLAGVAFSLLSAGVFRGSRSLRSVLKIGVSAIVQFFEETDKDADSDGDGDDSSGDYEELEEVHLCAFSVKEVNALTIVADELGLVQVIE